VVASVALDIVILQLRIDDLSRLDPLVVGSSIEEFVTILHDTYNVKLICVCQSLLGSEPVFDIRARAFNKYVKAFREALPYVFLWGLRGLWNSSQGFLARDGVYLNRQGQYKFFKVLKGPF